MFRILQYARSSWVRGLGGPISLCMVPKKPGRAHEGRACVQKITKTSFELLAFAWFQYSNPRDNAQIRPERACGRINLVNDRCMNL